MKRPIKIALVQQKCSRDVEENIGKASEAVRQAAGRGANVICLQELFFARYFAQFEKTANYRLAQRIPSGLTRAISALAREQKVVLIAPIYEEVQPGIAFNTALIFDVTGELLGRYRKTHIPESPQYREKFYFAPGNSGYPVFATRFGKIAVGICYDQWFPEMARIFALQGAELIFYPSAIGSEQDKPGYSSADAWQTVMRSHAICNGLFVAAVNRVGREDDMEFYGHSFVCNPFGEMIAQAGDSETTILANVDFEQVREMRELFHFLRDRRPETYGALLQLAIETESPIDSEPNGV